MWATLGRLVPPINQFIRSEEYMGQRIYVAAMGPPGQPPPPGRPTPAFCALEKQLVFAVQREDLERHLRGMGQEKRTLEDAPGYRLTSARLPAAPRAAFLFSDQRAQAKEQIESLRKHSGILGKAISEATQKCPPLFRPLLESIDFSKLPSEKTLGPYMAISSGCVMPREDGLEYVDVSAAARVIDRLAEAAK
jgi:hypothetical protein